MRVMRMEHEFAATSLRSLPLLEASLESERQRLAVTAAMCTVLSMIQVDPDAFTALQDCVFSGDFETCEGVPAGDPNGFLINPLGGHPVDMSGPAG